MLSPHLLAVYIDSLIGKVQSRGLGCYVRHICFNILLYADDILLLVPSVSARQSLLHVCEQELLQLDMAVNVRKSSCTRIEARYNAKCCCITTLNGAALEWTDTVRYLGVYITATHRFCCSLQSPQCQKIILSGPSIVFLAK